MDGLDVGAIEGLEVGAMDGLDVGFEVGAIEGLLVGSPAAKRLALFCLGLSMAMLLDIC
jgi:hypothetical protein